MNIQVILVVVLFISAIAYLGYKLLKPASKAGCDKCSASEKPFKAVASNHSE